MPLDLRAEECWLRTAGFGYTFFSPEVRKYGLPAGFDEFSGRFEDIEQPLLFEPGTKWNYGVNIDWACVALERATNMVSSSLFPPLFPTTHHNPDSLRIHPAKHLQPTSDQKHVFLPQSRHEKQISTHASTIPRRPSCWTRTSSSKTIVRKQRCAKEEYLQ